MTTRTEKQDGRHDGPQEGESGPASGEMSTFALDVFWAQGRSGDVEVASHVDGCERCQGYLAELDAIEARGPTLPRGPATSTRTRTRSAGNVWGLPAVVGAFGVLAAAAAVAIFLRGHDRPGDRYIGVKGTPAVQLLVHHGQQTHIWDGRAPLHPGDALALRVACEGLKRIVVAAPASAAGAAGDGTWQRLSESACPATDQPLPFTLNVDDQPGDEQLAVVLTQDAIDDESLQKSIAEERRAADVWVVRYVMPKERETDR